MEMALKLTAVKAKALILSALLLAPATATAGAQAVNAAPAPVVVKVTEAQLPVALSDEELDEVTGEMAGVVIRVVGNIIKSIAKHGGDRLIGDGAKRAGTDPKAVLDAVRNPVRVVEQVERGTVKYVGKDANVVISTTNPGRVVSTNPTSANGVRGGK